MPRLADRWRTRKIERFSSTGTEPQPAMPNPFAAQAGGVLSADIAVPKHDDVARFYGRVLSTGATPLWREDLKNSHGTPVIGVGARSPEYEHLPVQWMPHIQVADVARSAERGVELGGSELMHSKAKDGTSQWAVLRDPNGAAFGLIPVASDDDLPRTETDASTQVGCIAWLDLTVADASATRDFYRDVVGWAAEDVAMTGGEAYADYNMLREDGDAVAGICHARGINTGVPPVWMLYLQVADFGESLRRARQEGGQVLKESSSSAIVQDPAGACLAIAPA